MTKHEAPKAIWNTIDPTSLPTAMAKQYTRYKEAYAEMKAERKAFEDAISDTIAPAPGKRVVFGYNFGKLSIAIVDDDTKPKTPTGAISISALCKR
jgi:hypothetical protein